LLLQRIIPKGHLLLDARKKGLVVQAFARIARGQNKYFLAGDFEPKWFISPACCYWEMI